MAHCRRWLIPLAGVLLLGGCGGPYAWNDYLETGYYRGDVSRFPSLSVPAEVTGTVGDISADDLRSIVAEEMHVPATLRPNASAMPQERSSSRDKPANRIAWTFSGTPAAGGVDTEVHAQARYYSDNVLISGAEGTSVITNGRSDPRLRQLIADVASQLFPTTPRGGPGRR
jgi:hypothetical protein